MVTPTFLVKGYVLLELADLACCLDVVTCCLESIVAIVLVDC